MKGDSGKCLGTFQMRWMGVAGRVGRAKIALCIHTDNLGSVSCRYVQCLRSLVVFGVKLEACILHKESTTLFLYNTLSRTNTFQYLLSHTMEIYEAKCWKVELIAGLIHSSIVGIVTFLYCVSPSYNCWPIEIH